MWDMKRDKGVPNEVEEGGAEEGGEKEGGVGGEERRRGGEERRRGGEEERRRARLRTEWRIAEQQRHIRAEAGDGG